MPAVLDESALATALTELPAWSGDTTAIRRVVNAPSFLAGIGLVDRVAARAEERDHHPDIDIRWRTITFVLSTHTAGGVTELDVALAKDIESFIGDL